MLWKKIQKNRQLGDAAAAAWLKQMDRADVNGSKLIEFSFYLFSVIIKCNILILIDFLILLEMDYLSS